MKTPLLFLLFLLGTGLAAGIVAEDAEYLTFRQSDGVEARLRKRPQRTVIGLASLVPLWYIAGGEAVGVPSVKDKGVIPEAAQGLPKVGSSVGVNAEKVLALRPDLVLLHQRPERHRSLAKLLRQTSVPTLCVDYDNYADFCDLLDLFARLNGRTLEEVPEARGIVAGVERIRTQVPKGEAPVFAILFASASGFSLESDDTNTGMTAALLGGKNVLKEKNGPRRVRFGLESFLLADPEVVFVTVMGDAEGLREKFRQEITSLPAWKGLRAAKAGRVHFLPSELFLYVPGPRYPEAFRVLAGLLYPGKEFTP